MTPFDPNRPCVLFHARGQMVPLETRFWASLRRSLRRRGCELLLIGHHRPEEPMDAPLLRVRNSLDAVRHLDPSDGWRPWLETDDSLDEEFLLERERLWRGAEVHAAHVERRRAALYFYRDFYHHAVHAAAPRLTVIWNGQHAQEMILGDLARARGSTVWFVERGPLAGTIHLDPEGILGGSVVAGRSGWSWTDDGARARWQGVADRVLGRHRAEPATWWSQPQSRGAGALRARLGIPAGKRVILFAGQVDQDAQSILYSPHLAGCLPALRWFVAQVRGRGDVFVLGKHHPKSTAPRELLAEAVEGCGAWVDDVSIHDCLEAAERVVAINSTTLYEALARGTPILALGASLLRGKEIAYEITGLDGQRPVIDAWLEAPDGEKRMARWRDFAAHLLAEWLFTLDPRLAALGLRDADALAEVLAAEALRRGRPEPRGSIAYPPLDEVNLWDEQTR